MKVITQRDCIRSICNEWGEAYRPFDKYDGDKEEIFNRLLALNLETCSAKDVADIIGNTSWTDLVCHECGKRTDWILRVGKEPDWETNTACLCRDCARKVADYLEPEPTKVESPPCATTTSPHNAVESAIVLSRKNKSKTWQEIFVASRTRILSWSHANKEEEEE